MYINTANVCVGTWHAVIVAIDIFVHNRMNKMKKLLRRFAKLEQ